MFDGVHRFVLTQTQLRLLMGGLVGGGTWGFGDGHLDWNSSMFHTLVKGRCNPPLTTGGAEPGQTAFPQGLSYDGRLLDLRVKKYL